MMEAELKFWIDPNTDRRWYRMELIGEDWPEEWNVSYSYLETWGMLTWFYTPPLDPLGVVANQNYQMSETPQAYEFAQFLSNMHMLISQIKPTPEPESGLLIQDRRTYV